MTAADLETAVPGAARRPRPPSDTSIRYVSLVAMALVTTTVIYTRAWLDPLGPDSSYQSCLAAFNQMAAQPGTLGFAESRAPGLVDCLGQDAGVAVLLAAGGVVLLTLIAFGIYLLLPWWRIRRRGLVRVKDGTALAGFLAAQVDQVGMRRMPGFWVAPHATWPQGVAFGSQLWPQVQLNAGLVQWLHQPERRPMLAAIVRHELGHIRNRDLDHTALTIATWRSFLLVGLLPYAALKLLRPDSLQPRIALSVAALTVIMYLTYFSILRVREFHADATAQDSAAGPDDESALRQAVAGSHRPRLPWLSSHPSSTRRLELLNGSSSGLLTGVSTVAGAGLALAVTQANASIMVTELFVALVPKSFAMAGNLYFLAALGSTLLLASLCATVAWQRPGRTAPYVGALTVGFLVGQPLSIFYSGAGVWGVFGYPWMRAMVASGFLALLFTALLAWMRDCAEVWGRSRTSMVVAAGLASLAWHPALAAWTGYQDSVYLTSLHPSPNFPAWTYALRPPGTEFALSEYMPIFLVGTFPMIAVVLALPVLYFAVGAARSRQPDVRRGLSLAIGIGVAAAAACAGLATLMGAAVWAYGGPSQLKNLEGAGTYQMMTTVWLTAASAGLSAAVTALAARTARAGLAAVSALVTAGALLLLSPLPTALAMCGPRRLLECAPAARLTFGVQGVLGVPRALAAACVLATAAVLLVRRRQRPSEAPAAPMRRPALAFLAALTLILLGGLAAGGWFGYGLVRG